MERIPQSVIKRVALAAYSSTDHVTAATGKTIAVTISKNGAAFGNPSGGATNATEIASGWYYVDLSTTDTGTTGPLIVLGTAATVDPVQIAFAVVDSHNAGFDGVPSVTAGANGGLPLGDASGRVTLAPSQLFVKKNTQLSSFEFVMYSSTDHVTPTTGLTVTATRSIDGGAFAACANAVSEVGSGVYKITLAAADLNGTTIMVLFEAAGADSTFVEFITQT